MTLTEIYEMISNFRFPSTAAFAYIFIEQKSDADLMHRSLISSGYNVIKCRTSGYWEIRFWPGKDKNKPFKLPFEQMEMDNNRKTLPIRNQNSKA